MTPVNIFIVDDHKIVRDGLKSILAHYPGFHIVGEEGHPDKILTGLADVKADILILDVSLPSVSGIDLIKEIKTAHPDLRVVMLSMHDSPEYMFRSLKEGASAYLPKDIEAGEFVEALNQVMLKGSYFPSNMNFGNKEEIFPSIDGEKSLLLTTREIEILALMSKGMSSRQIAEKFTLSPRTVETHRVNIMKKLGTSNGAETVALALKLKLIQESGF